MKFVLKQIEVRCGCGETAKQVGLFKETKNVFKKIAVVGHDCKFCYRKEKIDLGMVSRVKARLANE